MFFFLCLVHHLFPLLCSLRFHARCLFGGFGFLRIIILHIFGFWFAHFFLRRQHQSARYANNSQKTLPFQKWICSSHRIRGLSKFQRTVSADAGTAMGGRMCVGRSVFAVRLRTPSPTLLRAFCRWRSGATPVTTVPPSLANRMLSLLIGVANDAVIMLSSVIYTCTFMCSSVHVINYMVAAL